MKKLISLLTIIACIFVLTGCGGGGGGGASDPVASAVNTSVTQSASVRDLVARDFSDKFRMLNNNFTEVNPSLRPVGNLRALSQTVNGVGEKTITYGPEDVVNQAGVNYTYTSGTQKVKYLDISGNLTDDKNLVDTIEIVNTDLKCRFNDGDDSYSMTYNGKLVFSGLQSKDTSKVQSVDLSASGMLNAYHSIQWTSNGTLFTTAASFPYPSTGSETGTMVIDNLSYDFKISYDGSKNASVEFSGAENVIVKIDMQTAKTTSVESNNLQAAYPQLYNSYQVMQTALQDNSQSADARMALFSPNIADDFVDKAGNANKKQELIDLTKSRLERYTVNSYAFTPVSYRTIDANTVEVTTDMFIDVARKPGATGAVSAASIPLKGEKVTWKKYGSEWKIYQGVPYLSSEIGI